MSPGYALGTNFTSGIISILYNFSAVSKEVLAYNIIKYGTEGGIKCLWPFILVLGNMAKTIKDECVKIMFY